jgi:hypothetical protein
VTASFVVFLAILGAFYIGAITLLLTIPAIIALFYPINGLSLTDRASNSVVVALPKTAKKKKA